MTDERKHILIVDDVTENIKILMDLLKPEYTTYFAKNGKTALEIAKTKKPDLILLDIVMQEMDGYEVCQKLKADDVTKDIPVIFISAMSEVGDETKGLEIGAADYIIKPISPPIVKARVKNQLKLREATQELKYLYKQLQDELAEAAQYVKTLLPKPVRIGSVKTDWRFIPSTSLGGDAFGYHWLDNEHFSMYLLDVAGHGVGSALLSVSVMNVMRNESLLNSDSHSPSKVLTSLNQAFQMEEHNNLFYSIWYGVYHTPSKTLTYSTAGHPPALLIDVSDPKHVIQLSTSNPVIGVMPDIIYDENAVTLDKHFLLYIYSDGVFEINKKDNTVWTFEEFIAFVSSQIYDSSQKRSLMDKLYDYTKSISKTDIFDDDFSILEINFE